VHEYGAAGPDVGGPTEVVAGRPVVVLAVDVQQADGLGPRRTYSRAAFGDQVDAGVGHIGQELVPGGRAAEHRPVDERIDGHDPSASGSGRQHDRRPALVAADLDDGPVGGAGGLPEGERLRLGQPARDGPGPLPYRDEAGVLRGGRSHDSPSVSAR